MLCPRASLAAVLALALAVAGATAIAQDMGIPELRQAQPSLTGSGITVAQVEASSSEGADDFEVDPTSIGSSAQFVYISGSGTAYSYPNSVGTSSDHAHYVADNFYGDAFSPPEGVAPGVSTVYNYEADYFLTNIIAATVPPSIPAEIVNQSFNGYIDSDQVTDQDYDNYADKYGTLFITGAGNGGPNGTNAPVTSPADAYNGIAVGTDDPQPGVGTSTGTTDGRCKPDIVAVSSDPSGDTSYTTGVVSGAATLLLQAALDGDAGSSSQVEKDASDARVLKALLLNGATKPAGWTNTDTAPLDPTYGAGILNVYNSYLNLAAGKQSFSASQSGAVQPLASGPVDPDEGWDLNTLENLRSGGSYQDESNHYDFDLTASTAPAFTLTATLIWWREANESSINNLFLYLFNTDTGQTIAESISTVDNTQEIYIPDLAPGDYDLAVVKSADNLVSTSDTYALAFNFAPLPEPSLCWLLLPALAILPAFRPRRLRPSKTGVS